MPDYVKICPKCRHQNPEDENSCHDCGFFLGLVKSGPAPASSDTDNPIPITIIEDEPTGSAPEHRPTGPTLNLEHQGSGRRFTVYPGDVVGQAHATNTAQLQLAGLPDIEYVSRRHCQFLFEDGRWFVAALPTALNPTRVNQLPVAAGGRVRLRSGDELTLANVKFAIVF